MCWLQWLLLWWYHGNLRTSLCLTGEPVFLIYHLVRLLESMKANYQSHQNEPTGELIFSTILLSCSSKHSCPDVTKFRSMNSYHLKGRMIGWVKLSDSMRFIPKDTNFWRMKTASHVHSPPFLGQWGWRHPMAGGTTPEAQVQKTKGSPSLADCSVFQFS